MKYRPMQIYAGVACFILAVALVGCGASSTAGTDRASSTPPENPPLMSLAQAKEKLSFQLVLPRVVPPGTVLEGVGVTHMPANASAVPSTPGARANWAIAQYNWSKGREGGWFHVFTIKETTTSITPPPASPGISVPRAYTASGSTPTQPSIAHAESPSTIMVHGVQVDRSVTTFNDIGSSGNQKGSATDYQWESRGVGFDLTRYGDQISESMAVKIIDSMIK